MLRVTLEIIPHGDEDFKSTIGVLEIINDGTGNHELGNYVVYVDPDSGGDKFTVKNFVRFLGAWELVKEVLVKKAELLYRCEWELLEKIQQRR